jgi:hypothetical protein
MELALCGVLDDAPDVSLLAPARTLEVSNTLTFLLLVLAAPA